MPKPSFSVAGGRVIRHEMDQSFQLLKTSIVASIGKPEKYPLRITELDGTHWSRNKITYPYLVKRFYEGGVDIIRLNLSYVDLDRIRETFLAIKKAIVDCEGKSASRKRIAVMADLPGPKIRLHLKKGMKFEVGQHFAINFEGELRSNTEATVKVDEKPLKSELQSVDEKTVVHLVNAGPDCDEIKMIKENVLGGVASTYAIGIHSYRDMLASIETATESEGGLRIVLGDGEVVLQAKRGALDRGKSCLKCRVVSKRGERFKERIGFTLKGLDFHIPSFTEEDRDKVHSLLQADYEPVDGCGSEPVVAFVALSFAQTADDVLRAKRSIEDKLRTFGQKKSAARLNAPSLIAKIETKKGLDNRRHIIDVADGIMVARGDLGLQMEIEKVPTEQKRLIRLCNKRGKPVITATEMLKSMSEGDEPTRAEATDVFNAIVDGSDAVMMSAETSSGSNPFHAINKMIAIAVEAERFHEYRGVEDQDLRRAKCLARIEDFLKDDIARISRNDKRFKDDGIELTQRKTELRSSANDKEERRALQWREEVYEEKGNKSKNQLGTNLITQAAAKMSENRGVRCILAASTSGRTVRMISRLRPTSVIVGAAHDPINTRRLTISYGVLPICIPEVSNRRGPDGVFEKCQELIASDSFLSDQLLSGGTGQSQVIFTAGTPLRKPGTTNLIQTRELRGGPRVKRALIK